MTLKILFTSIFLLTFFSNSHAQTPDATSNNLKLKIEGNNYSDETVIYFHPQATPGFDPAYDAYKLMGIPAAPQIYSIIECCNLSINALPEIFNGLTVQLGYKVGVSTNYSITAIGLETFGADTSIVLEDTKLNQWIFLKDNPVYTFMGETTDDVQRFRLYFFCPMQYNISVFLEGPFDGNEMHTELNQTGLIPFEQPYNAVPWNYYGNESVTSLPNTSVVDWILVELRDAPEAFSADESTMVGSHACFLMNDGTIKGLDGISPPLFSEVFQDSIFVVIRHRNHLDIMSSTPLPRTGGIYHYNFADGDEKAFGSSAQKEIGSNVFGMVAGDANADDIVSAIDKTANWESAAGTFGYQSSDFDMNGVVDNLDKNDKWLNNIDQSVQIPGNSKSE